MRCNEQDKAETAAAHDKQVHELQAANSCLQLLLHTAQAANKNLEQLQQNPNFSGQQARASLLHCS